MTYRPGTETLLTQVVSTAINRVPVWCPRPVMDHSPLGVLAGNFALPPEVKA
jgi:hypothetical protein